MWKIRMCKFSKWPSKESTRQNTICPFVKSLLSGEFSLEEVATVRKIRTPQHFGALCALVFF